MTHNTPPQGHERPEHSPGHQQPAYPPGPPPPQPAGYADGVVPPPVDQAPPPGPAGQGTPAGPPAAVGQPPPPANPPPSTTGSKTSPWVRIGGAVAILAAAATVVLITVLPAYSIDGTWTLEHGWTWLDTLILGRGNELAPLGAVAMLAVAALAGLSGLASLILGNRPLGFLGAATGLIAAAVTFICGLVFVIMLIADADLERGSYGVWGLFLVSLMFLVSGIVAFIGSITGKKKPSAAPPGAPMPAGQGPAGPGQAPPVGPGPGLAGPGQGPAGHVGPGYHSAADPPPPPMPGQAPPGHPGQRAGG